MGRCRCTDISNANIDLKKLADTRDYLDKARQGPGSTVFGVFGQCARDVLDGATPNNAFILKSIENILEKPVNNSLMESHDKTVSKIRVLPVEIQALSREDTAYHEAIATRSRIHTNPR
jgi:hypothetical protein